MEIPAFAAIEAQERGVRPGRHERLEHTHPRATAAVALSLRWKSDEARHTDCYVANELNLWRDILPPELESGLVGRGVGEVVAHSFEPGAFAPAYDERQLMWLRDDQFNRRFRRGGMVQPRVGRFYPKGILERVPGVFSGNMLPFRVTALELGRLQADLNHPLAGRPVDVQAKLLDIWQPREEHGGVCNDVAETVAANGPGMQARWRGRSTDFWSDLPFVRADPTPDDRFYAGARLVHHLDTTARRQIGRLYAGLIPLGGRVLDLMSSWASHLPEDLETGPVTGLGMNREELDANSRLTERVVHDLNREPRLPFPDDAFDAVICTASVEYLVEPFDVFAEVARILRPGGRFVVTFSNRRFPPKVIRIWEDMHEFERPGLVVEYFLRCGRFASLETCSLRGLPRPADDKYAGRMPFSDPVFAVWAETV
jgi:SAM-dependent methyltransferase